MSAKSMNQPSSLVDLAAYVQRDLEGVAVQPGALVVGRDHRQAVGGLERELLEDLHALADAQQLVRLQAESPLRMLEAVLRRRLAMLASSSGPSIGCRKKCSKSASAKRSGCASGCG